jgi:hypothetical protein
VGRQVQGDVNLQFADGDALQDLKQCLLASLDPEEKSSTALLVSRMLLQREVYWARLRVLQHRPRLMLPRVQ